MLTDQVGLHARSRFSTTCNTALRSSFPPKRQGAVEPSSAFSLERGRDQRVAAISQCGVFGNRAGRDGEMARWGQRPGSQDLDCVTGNVCEQASRPSPRCTICCGQRPAASHYRDGEIVRHCDRAGHADKGCRDRTARERERLLVRKSPRSAAGTDAPRNITPGSHRARVRWQDPTTKHVGIVLRAHDDHRRALSALGGRASLTSRSSTAALRRARRQSRDRRPPSGGPTRPAPG